MRNDEEFLVDIAKGLQPRTFGSSGIDKYIYHEDQEVSEMYFVLKGYVGIGINIHNKSDGSNPYKLAYNQIGSQIICDYYIITKRKANFNYICLDTIHAYSISRKYWHDYLFKKKDYQDYISFIEFES